MCASSSSASSFDSLGDLGVGAGQQVPERGVLRDVLLQHAIDQPRAPGGGRELITR
jgi:hypothetical protein